MKFTQFLLAAGLIYLTACSSVMTRKEAAEDAKLKAVAAENAPPPISPIEDEEYSNAPGTGSQQKPADDQVLNDELAAMGIDPSNPDGRNQEETPEPEVQGAGVSPHGNPVPMPEGPAPAVKKKVATKKSTAKKKLKKPAKKK